MVERAIQTVVHSERTMMLHQALLWPDHFDIRMWPFALDHAVYIWNRVPSTTPGLAHVDLYTYTKLEAEELRNKYMWGFPVYVLDPKLQDGKKLPKWDHRTRQG